MISSIYKRTILFTVCILILISCGNIGNDDLVSKHELYIQEDIYKTVDLNELFDFVDFIPLETKDKSFISNVSKIIYYGNCLYILDRKFSNLFVYREDGLFLNKISEKGKGPQEYITLADFSISNKNGDLYLFDNGLRKLLIYNSEGVFQKSISLKFTAKNFECIGDYLIFYANKMQTDESKNFDVLVTDMNGKIMSRYLEYPKDNTFRFSPPNALHKYNNEIVINSYFSNIIWGYQPDKLYPKINIEFENPIPYEFTYDLGDFEKFGTSYCFPFGNYVETDNLIYFNYFDNKKMKDVLIDKETNKRLIINHLTMNIFSQDFFPQSRFKAENLLICVIYDFNNWVINSNYIDRSEFDFTKYYQVVSNRKEIDNPVLMLLRFKGID